MNRNLEILQDINSKYQLLEIDLNEQIKINKDNEEKFTQSNTKSNVKESQNDELLSFGTSKIRNHELLKSLEMSKARLRSRATFSPIEIILMKSKQKYLSESTIQKTTYM